jgi:hypothetical protein
MNGLMNPVKFISLNALSLLACISACWGQTSAENWESHRDAAQKAFASCDFDRADNEWKEALTAAERSGQIEPGMVTCLVGLAFVQDKQGHAQESERLYELGMRNMEGLVGPASPRFADWMPSLAFLYDSHGKSDKAEILFKRALLIKTGAFGWNDARVAEVLEQYARFLRKNERQTEATDLELKARTIRQKLAP